MFYYFVTRQNYIQSGPIKSETLLVSQQNVLTVVNSECNARNIAQEYKTLDCYYSIAAGVG